MNPLMQSMGQPNGMVSLVDIARMLKSGDPRQIAMNLMQRNPQFRQFIQANQGKTPEQVAKENGVDFSQIMGMMR